MRYNVYVSNIFQSSWINGPEILECGSSVVCVLVVCEHWMKERDMTCFRKVVHTCNKRTYNLLLLKDTD